jgi:hypothetical protein
MWKKFKYIVSPCYTRKNNKKTVVYKSEIELLPETNCTDIFFSPELSKDSTRGRSTIATRVRNQTAWDRLQNLVETLEPHLVEGNKALRRIKTLTPWTPSPQKAFPHHITLRKQVGCHCHRLQTCLWDTQQTNQVNTKYHAEFPQPSPG